MLVYDVPVLHLVNRFWIGGAERQFVERLRLHPAGFEAVVACLETSGPMFEQVRALGYEPIVFPLKGTMLQAPLWPLPDAVLRRRKTGFGVPVREWISARAGTESKRERGLRGWAKVVYAHFAGSAA